MIKTSAAVSLGDRTFCEYLLRINSGSGNAEYTASFKTGCPSGQRESDICYIDHDFPMGTLASSFCISYDG